MPFGRKPFVIVERCAFTWKKYVLIWLETLRSQATGVSMAFRNKVYLSIERYANATGVIEIWLHAW